VARDRKKKKILVVAYSTVGISNIATRLWNNIKYGGKKANKKKEKKEDKRGGNLRKRGCPKIRVKKK
jgi:hypothetical protein